LSDDGSFRQIGSLAGKAVYDERRELTSFSPSKCWWGARGSLADSVVRSHYSVMVNRGGPTGGATTRRP
jgi:hypothetical protein